MNEKQIDMGSVLLMTSKGQLVLKYLAELGPMPLTEINTLIILFEKCTEI